MNFSYQELDDSIYVEDDGDYGLYVRLEDHDGFLSMNIPKAEAIILANKILEHYND